MGDALSPTVLRLRYSRPNGSDRSSESSQRWFKPGMRVSIRFSINCFSGCAEKPQALKCCSMPKDEFEHGSAVVEETESKTRLERPPLYKVLLHNDDFTPMEFVVFILQTIFNHGENDAVRLMLDVHRKGIGFAGIYTYEVAEMKVEKVTSLAQANEFPLLCTMEEDDDHKGT